MHSTLRVGDACRAFRWCYIYKRSFDGATFGEEADFLDTTFTKEADFLHTTFTKEASFNSANFKEAVFFIQTTFKEKAIFDDITFPDDAIFSVPTFSKEANFVGATFTEGDFSSATFTKEANFDSTTFTTEANFYDAKFTERVEFGDAKFIGRAFFGSATFTKEANFINTKFQNADFSQAKFLNEVRFSGSEVFTGKTIFRYTIFEQPNEALFDVNDLSKVSFAGSDISKVTFTDKVKWGGNDNLKIIEEDWIETGREKISLDLVLYVYRRLRANYEFNLKFYEAGKFFIKEMELKRNFRTISRSSDSVIKNDWFRRHFSLTALYHHFYNYGESIIRPTIIGIITVAFSILFWLMQSKLTLEPHFFINTSLYHSTSHFVYLSQETHWLEAFQRSLADFLPILSLPGDVKVGVIDYIIKIVGGALTFGLLIIAFRRKFERKYTRWWGQSFQKCKVRKCVEIYLTINNKNVFVFLSKERSH